MLEKLKESVYEANMMLPRNGLVVLTWGNVSGYDQETGLIVIKPSGIEYEKLSPNDMVVVDLKGNKIEGKYNPSSDTATHIEIYKAFEVGGVVHTHSSYATSWAQAGRNIPCYGTTHADDFYGDIPCVKCLKDIEINNNYEKNTGLLIVKEFERLHLDAKKTPAVLCKNHGSFVWGKKVSDAVCNAIVLEQIAKMAYHTEMLNPKVETLSKPLMDKHYYRKHGKSAYYGQNNGNQ